jgi:hypothetical protein
MFKKSFRISLFKIDSLCSKKSQKKKAYHRVHRQTSPVKALILFLTRVKV